MIGGELIVHIKRQYKFNQELTIFYASELILALDHLHKNDYIFRELKPQNILISSDGHLKITDVGLLPKGKKSK